MALERDRRAVRRAARRGAAGWSPRRSSASASSAGRELTTGSDLDLFVVYGDGAGRRPTATARAVEAHIFYDRAVEALGGAPRRHHRGRRRRSPSTCACGPARRAAASPRASTPLERYYREWADPWERQTLTRARLVGGDPRARPGGAARASAACSTGPRRPPPRPEGDARAARAHGARARQGDARALPRQVRPRRPRRRGVHHPGARRCVHGARHPGVRRANTSHAIARDPARAGSCPTTTRTALDRALSLPAARLAPRSGSSARARPTRWSSPARSRRGSPRALDYPSRKEFLEDYRRRTAWVRALYDRIVPAQPVART